MQQEIHLTKSAEEDVRVNMDHRRPRVKAEDSGDSVQVPDKWIWPISEGVWALVVMEDYLDGEVA